MKKLVIFISILAMTVSLSSCGKKEHDSALVGNGSNTETTAEPKSENKESNSDKKENAKDEKKAESAQGNDKSNTAQSDNTSAEEPEKVTPTFMFFVSKKDSDYEKAMKAVDELKKSYEKKINFDIVDIDENPDAKKNFPVEGQTPTLIMLNTSNDISAFEFKISDKDKMENAIKNALE